MFNIKRGNEYFVKSAIRYIGIEPIQIVTWSKNKARAFQFAEKIQAQTTNSMLGYTDTEIVKCN